MKAERINKNQIRFTLTKADLQARQLKITDLSYGSDKTKALFDDMMQQAVNEFGFDTSSGKPLMIEAIPISDESLMITVTQVTGHEDLLSMFRSNIPGAEMGPEETALPFEHKDKSEPPVSESKETILVYTFASFDDVLAAARLIQPGLRLRNQLYKNEHDGCYYLKIHYTRPNSHIRYVMTLLTEYCASVTKDPFWISHMEEHNKLAVQTRALQKLAAMENS